MSKKMGLAPARVLHVIHRMRPGGVQALVMNVYRNTDRQMAQFDFAVRTNRKEHYDDEVTKLGGRIFRLPWQSGNPFSILAYTRALRQVLRQDGPFIALHSHIGFNSGPILALARQASIPVRIAHSHSSSTGKRSALRDIWAVIMRRSIHRNATHLLACSVAAAEWLYGPDILADSRFSIVPNAIDLARYESREQNRKTLRKTLGLPSDGILLGHVGRFDAVKNHAFLLEIFSSFLDLCPGARLILVGEGVLERRVRRQVEEAGLAGSVLFMGARSDVPQILSALDLLLLPSLHEGLGMVLIEAQAAGVPSLASDVVPREADLELGLVEFKSLDETSSAWAGKVMRLVNHQAPSRQERNVALRDAGYDVQQLVRMLQVLYLSSAH